MTPANPVQQPLPVPVWPQPARQEAQNVGGVGGVGEGAEETVEDNISVFPVETLIKVLIGAKTEARINLEYTNESFLDLSDLDNKICREVDLVCKEKRLSALDIVRRTFFIRHNPRLLKQENLRSFNLQEAQSFFRLLESAKRQHPRGLLEVVVEIETIAPISRRSRASSSDDSSLRPPIPPTVSSKRRRRTDDLEDEAKARKKSRKKLRQEKIAFAGDFEAQLTDRLTCNDKDCQNEENFC